ncbi:hypothetical protein CgunFtcFv8_026259 [Champsocephalus gunnari]|uniref:Uncharacterized protein n=1 Tax=Champsocephalus gunnari TaxID=52237 RepID=A0AAN8CC22_CHAGU|nr:hypothetical protein CgunFtcFv8_026259 [Champsocephalus gunnari]
MDSGRGETRRLAGGSGWIRVNLDHGFLLPDGERDEEGDKFGLHITDTLVESDSDIYAANFDGDESENVSSDYYNVTKINVKRPDNNWNDVGNRGMVSQNNLERAVLMPILEEGVVYFSPSKEKEEEGEEGQGEGEEGQGEGEEGQGGGEEWQGEGEEGQGEGEEGQGEGEEGQGGGEQGQGGGELELGLGAVLSLLGLSAVLCLANCLPCALQDRRSPLMGENREAGLERAAEKEEEKEREKMEVEKSKKDERNKTEGEYRIEQHDMNSTDDMKEVEIIC